MDPDYEAIYSENTDVQDVDDREDQDQSISQIKGIIDAQFKSEIAGLEDDIVEIDKRLNHSRLMLDRLRAAILISFYDKNERNPDNMSANKRSAVTGIHPALKAEIGKSIPSTLRENSDISNGHLAETSSNQDPDSSATKISKKDAVASDVTVSKAIKQSNVTERTKHRIIVGNVSKYLPVETRQKNDQVFSICSLFNHTITCPDNLTLSDRHHHVNH